jgi:hypothetical protein
MFQKLKFNLKDFFNSSFAFLRNSAHYIRERPTLIVFTLSIWLFTLNFLCAKFADVAVKDSCAMDNLKTVNVKNKEFALKNNVIPLNAVEKNRMMLFQTSVENRKVHHYKVMRLFLIEYYADIMMLCFIGPVTGILLFFMLQAGFNNASQGMKTLFVVHAASSIVFTAFPSIFKMDDNIQFNKDLYTKYTAVENDMLTYLSTGKTQFEPEGSCVPNDLLEEIKSRSTKTDSLTYQYLSKVKKECIVSFPDYAVKLDKELKGLENISIGFDFQKFQIIVPSIRSFLMPQKNSKRICPLL